MTKYAPLGGEESAATAQSLLFNESSDENEQPEMSTAEMGERNGRRIKNDKAAEQRRRRIPLQHCHALLLQQKENQDKSPERLLHFVACVSTLYLVVQFTGGLLANSLAIIADCGHVLTDLASFLISIYMIRISKRPANRRFSFGLLRAEFIGALASLFIIWTITCLMVVFATQRIVAGTIDVQADIMLITALIGICFNLFMAGLLKFSKAAPQLMAHHHHHGHGHGHGHHSHLNNFSNGNPPNQMPSSSENVNIRAAFIHVFGDLIQSIGVLLAALAIRWTGFQLADPLCTYLFSLIVICTSIPVARDILSALMEATPRHLDHLQISKDLLMLDSVSRAHSLQIWSLNTTHFAASVHLIIEDATKSNAITCAATQLLQQKHGIHFTTVQIEQQSVEDAQNAANFECNFCQENELENDDEIIFPPSTSPSTSSFTSPFSQP